MISNEHYLGENFLAISRKSIKLYRQMCTDGVKEYDFTTNEVDVLVFLINNPTLNKASDISKYRGISKALVCTAVDNLTNKGYLSVQVKESDRRIQHLALEPKAESVVYLLKKARKNFFEVLYDGIDEKQCDSLRSSIQIMTQNIERLK